MATPAALKTPSDLETNAITSVADALNALLADSFALYLKTKNFHWHVSGPHFRDYHLLLDDQATQIDAMTDVIAERVRKLGASTIKSVGHIKRLQRVLDNDAEYVTPHDMLAELREELFDADGKRKQLRLLDDDRDGALVLIGLNIKHTLTGLANRVSGDVVAGVNVNFKAGHELP